MSSYRLPPKSLPIPEYPGPTSVHPKRQLDRFIRFCRAHARDQQTDRQRDHATCVTVGRILCSALWCRQISNKQNTSRCVPAWRWWCIGPVVVGNVGDNSVSSCRLHASETQQLADATPICYLCGVARRQPSTNDGPTCNNPSNTAVKRLTKVGGWELRNDGWTLSAAVTALALIWRRVDAIKARGECLRHARPARQWHPLSPRDHIVETRQSRAAGIRRFFSYKSDNVRYALGSIGYQSEPAYQMSRSDYWQCPHTTQSRVYVSAGCPSVCRPQQQRAAGLLLSVQRAGGEFDWLCSWVDCYANYTPTEWSWAPTLVQADRR